jgi:hypothetical protein
MPWGDWQFWVVTVAAFVSLAAVARVVIPRRKRGTRTALTVSAPSKRS